MLQAAIWSEETKYLYQILTCMFTWAPEFSGRKWKKCSHGYNPRCTLICKILWSSSYPLISVNWLKLEGRKMISTWAIISTIFWCRYGNESQVMWLLPRHNNAKGQILGTFESLVAKSNGQLFYYTYFWFLFSFHRSFALIIEWDLYRQKFESKITWKD
jgi:hypothetical protein